MTKHRHVLSFILLSLVIYIFLYGFYLLLSNGIPDKTIYLQLRRYIPCALVAAGAVLLWLRAGLPVLKLAPHLFVSLSWYLVFPLSYWATFHLNTSFIDNHYDIVFAAYIFAATVCLRLVLLHHCTNAVQQKSDAFLLGLLHTLLLIVPVIQAVYFFQYHSPVTEAGAMAVIQTDPHEAREFILLNYGYTGVLSLCLFWLVVLYIFYHLNYITKTIQRLTPKLLILALVITLGCGFYCHKIFPETGVMNAYLNAQSYFELSSQFHKYHAGKFAALEVTPPQKTFQKPATVIMVIGESASRAYMSAYGYQDHDTTPWMREMSGQLGFLLFKHVYTSWGQTVPALERALTEKNQYNNKEFNQSVTILDLAKKAGYTTYWYSAQGTMGGADSPITMVAKTADHSAWIQDTLANTNELKYDGDLLPYLKKVDPTKNNFVVLHIMGSHDNYINRYPPDFTRWGTKGVYEPIIDYDNSIAYTDDFLQKVYAYGKKNLNLQAMLYFSDHGADPRYMRHPNSFGFISLRIPFFLYLGEEYRNLYPETTTALQSHKDSYFTNDLLYDTMGGILNLKSSQIEEENSLASPKYKYKRENLVTKLGALKLTDDVDEEVPPK